MNIIRTYPKYKDRLYYEKRYKERDFEKFNKMINDEDFMNNYQKWKQGINYKTNRKIKIQGDTHKKIDCFYQYIGGFGRVYIDDMININQVDYLKENIEMVKDITNKNKDIDRYNDIVKSVIDKIKNLDKWDDYVEFEGKYYGLGNNTTKLSPTLIPDFNNIKAISAGVFHSLFLDNNGNVYSCGDNQYGQLGLGHNTTKLSPTLINYFDDNNIKIKAIYAGVFHSLFLNNNGNVYGCGDNQYGQLGLGNNTRKLSPTLIPNFNNITAISAGNFHSLFLDNNGNVYSCGDNYRGQLGLGDDNTTKLTPTLIPNFNNIKAISTGIYHSLFLNNNGNVYSCGYNLYGQLGLNDNINRESPVLINYFNDNTDRDRPTLIPNFNNITAISAGLYHSLFL